MDQCTGYHLLLLLLLKVKGEPRHTSHKHSVVERCTGYNSTGVLMHACCENNICETSVISWVEI